MSQPTALFKPSSGLQTASLPQRYLRRAGTKGGAMATFTPYMSCMNWSSGTAPDWCSCTGSMNLVGTI